MDADLDPEALLVVGAGLIGLEVAASAAELGVKTTVLEVAPRILARVCDPETSALVQAHHAAHFAIGKNITGADPVPVADRGNIGKMTEAWLRWARANGYQ